MRRDGLMRGHVLARGLTSTLRHLRLACDTLDVPICRVPRVHLAASYRRLCSDSLQAPCPGAYEADGPFLLRIVRAAWQCSTVSNAGSSVAARVVAVIGGAFATLSAVTIHQTSALPFSIALDLAGLVGAEAIMPWAIAIGLVVLGWMPAFVPRAGWLIGVLVFVLGGVALVFARFGGYALGTLSAFLAAVLFFAAAKKARRARKAAKAQTSVPAAS